MLMIPQNYVFMLELKIWNKAYQIDNSVIMGKGPWGRKEEMVKGISADKYFTNT